MRFVTRIPPWRAVGWRGRINTNIGTRLEGRLIDDNFWLVSAICRPQQRLQMNWGGWKFGAVLQEARLMQKHCFYLSHIRLPLPALLLKISLQEWWHCSESSPRPVLWSKAQISVPSTQLCLLNFIKLLLTEGSYWKTETFFALKLLNIALTLANTHCFCSAFLYKNSKEKSLVGVCVTLGI